ncbi:MAG TPA: hypothetical protein VGD83_37555 [Streptosporangiaceae bacterium]
MHLQHGQRGVLAETSRFIRHNRHWTYLGPTKGQLPSALSPRSGAMLDHQGERLHIESEQFTMVSATLLVARRSCGSGRCRPARRPV